MNVHRNHLDDSLSFLLVVAFVLLAFGLQLSSHNGFSLDRGSAQARAGDKEKAVRLAGAASEAARAKEVRLAQRRP